MPFDQCLQLVSSPEDICCRRRGCKSSLSDVGTGGVHKCGCTDTLLCHNALDFAIFHNCSPSQLQWCIVPLRGAANSAHRRRYEGRSNGGAAEAELASSGVREAMRENVMGAGQSKRIWGELYKVIDSSDVVVQVGACVTGL